MLLTLVDVVGPVQLLVLYCVYEVAPQLLRCSN